MGSKYVIDGNTVYEVDDGCKKRLLKMQESFVVPRDEKDGHKKDKRLGKVSIC